MWILNVRYPHVYLFKQAEDFDYVMLHAGARKMANGLDYYVRTVDNFELIGKQSFPIRTQQLLYVTALLWFKNRENFNGVMPTPINNN